MDFEWDERKNRLNLRKHGLMFEDAIAVFDDPRELTEPARTIGEEHRRQTIGRAASATILVVHTERRSTDGEPVIRIISARAASRSERKRYER